VTKKASLSLSNLRLDSGAKKPKESTAKVEFKFNLPTNLSKKIDNTTDKSSAILMASFSG
jgi:hypothetical protein